MFPGTGANWQGTMDVHAVKLPQPPEEDGCMQSASWQCSLGCSNSFDVPAECLVRWLLARDKDTSGPF